MYTGMATSLPIKVMALPEETPVALEVFPRVHARASTTAAVTSHAFMCRVSVKKGWKKEPRFAPPSSVVEVLLHVTARQESSNDEIGDFAAQPLAGGLVEPEMLSPKNPAERRLVGGVPEGAERTLHPAQHLRREAELEGTRPGQGR